MPSDTYGDFDDQDGAEAFDEDNLTPDGDGRVHNERRTFEELPDLLDVTAASGDEDDDEAAIGEELDDEEIIALEADSALADPEDDDLARRMPEALLDASEDDGLRWAPDEAPFVPVADIERILEAENEADAADLEAEALDDEDLKDLGYQQR